jgi:cytidyltransferase-like protein
MAEKKRVAVSRSFDNLRSEQVRFLEEAAKLGPVQAFVWDDETVERRTGRPPKFPVEERLYVVASLRFVGNARISSIPDLPFAGPDFSGPRDFAGSAGAAKTDLWVVAEGEIDPKTRESAEAAGIGLRVIPKTALAGFPGPPAHLADQLASTTAPSDRPKVIVTGCFDWLHSGHVRFFEEASAYGDVTVDVGSDANIRLLKGGGHPLFSEAERLYLVRAVRFVHQAFIGTGSGWMDAAPEIELLKPDFYVVNEDGDRPEKREFCAARGIAYVVLARLPAAGLARRDSTALRGF